MNEGHLRGRKDKALMRGMLQWAKMLQKVYGVCLCPGKKRADGNTNRALTEIGEQCGFHDMSYFAKTFREIQGCSPGEYRRQIHA